MELLTDPFSPCQYLWSPLVLLLALLFDPERNKPTWFTFFCSMCAFPGEAYLGCLLVLGRSCKTMLSCSFSSPGSIKNCSFFHLPESSLVDFVLFTGLVGVLGGEHQGESLFHLVHHFHFWKLFLLNHRLAFSFRSLKILLYCLYIILMINLLKPFFICVYASFILFLLLFLLFFII